ncbi:8-amino-7-oxononanoate synthase [Candidatus Gastranaerophilus sp. (ex Termes propinquus)]|nr:8-amino-7-oxononanoate synthase [Candidatus Gastranaerophilus sp. (ex Termes propinquus)]
MPVALNALDILEDELEKLKTNSSYREIKNVPEKCLNLSSNDYLGIAKDTALVKTFLKDYNGALSSPSARLLGCDSAVFATLERSLEKRLNKERALLFNSGYHANVGTYSALLKSDDVVFCDRLCHASIIDGIKLSGAKVIPFKHLNYEDLREKLQKYRRKYKKAVISTETLFSMDGDFASLGQFVELKKEFDCLLFIDEAHTFGVYAKGAGYAVHKGLSDDIDLLMGTFGKAFGSYGAFCAGNSVLINYLINFARPFVFSTTLPPVSAAFSSFVLEQDTSERAQKLFSLSKKVRQELDLPGESYIIPVVLGENELAVRVSETLVKNGYYAPPVRYPTVSKNTARLRISLNANMEYEMLKNLVSLLKNYKIRAL